MGFSDLFDDANHSFLEDVGKAWNELREDASDDNGSANNGLSEFFSGRTMGLLPNHRLGDTLRNLNDLLETGKNDHRPRQNPPCSKPAPGTPVYCKLAGVAEHTGIYVGDDKIVHLNGDGEIEAVSPQEFVSRLDGLNPAVFIYYAANFDGTPLCKKSIANRARSMVGSRRNYNWAFDNCHQFTCGCLSGDFENPCNAFWMVKMEIMDKLGPFIWKTWDY